MVMVDNSILSVCYLFVTYCHRLILTYDDDYKRCSFQMTSFVDSGFDGLGGYHLTVCY